MSNLNNRFLSELFDQKKVRCHQGIYNKVFHDVWPCEWYFREFLSCSVTDLKIDYAKKIFGHLRAFEDVILPEFMVNNIISTQQKQLVPSNDGYIPQDHVIHSINLYILGIYLFFNFPLFHKKILSKESSSKALCEKIKSFIKKWKIFSLFHDVGYYFESNINGSGIILEKDFSKLYEYNKLYSYLIHEYVTRSVARTILCAAIVQRSHRKLDPTDFAISPSKQWVGGDGDLVAGKEIIDMLTYYKDATIVEDVQSDNAYSNFVMVLDKQRTLVIIYNQDEYPIGYLEQSKNIVNKIYFAKGSALDKADIYGEKNYEVIWDRLPSGYTLSYCVKDADEVVYAHLPIEYAPLAKRYYNQLPESFRLKLSFITTDVQVNQCYFDIYQWLNKKTRDYLWSSDLQSEYQLYKHSMKKHYEAAVNSCLSKHISNIVHDFERLESSEIQNLLRNVVKSLQDKNVASDLTNQIHTTAAQSYSIEEGISHDMLTYYQQFHCQVIRDFLRPDTTTLKSTERKMKDRLDKLQFIQFESNRITKINVFEHGESHFESTLYEKIKQYAETLRIDFDKLTSYSTTHTKSDHGLVSAGLLYQAAVFSHCLAQYATSHDALKLAWHGLSGYQSLSSEQCIDDYAEVIFSILLHNIYTYNSNQAYGIDYKHSIDDDPFSYFCAFCDTFQKWHRPKQIDYSKTGLPSKHFLSDEFDLLTTEERICLKVDSNDASFIRRSLCDENMYLPGMLDLVHVSDR